MANRRDFRAFVSRVGAARAAKRFGISEKTLAGWARKGVPAQRVAGITAILKRSAAAVQAAATKRRDQDFRDGEWREVVRLPPKQKRGENLTDEQRIPRRDPRTDSYPATKRMRERLKKQTGWAETLSANWVLMNSPFEHVGQDVIDFQLDAPAWGERVLQLWRQMDPSPAPKDTRVWMVLQMERYFPDNPAYKGKPGLESKVGHWVPMRAISLGAETEGGAVELPLKIISARNKVNRGGPRVHTIGSILDDAESRDFWVVGFHIQVGYERPPVDLAEVVSGEERRPRPKKPKRKAKR